MQVDSKPYTFSPFGKEIVAETQIKLIHVNTKYFLHSHHFNYITGSKQQEVTCFPDQGDDGNWWVIRAEPGPVRNGQVVRLTHMVTGRNLHSHKGIRSPATGQQEVTCFGEQGNGDDNDLWVLEFEENNCKQHKLDDVLRTGTYFRLTHKLTGNSLHSHDGHHTHSKQQEVTGFNGKDSNDIWYVWVIGQQ